MKPLDSAQARKPRKRETLYKLWGTKTSNNREPHKEAIDSGFNPPLDRAKSDPAIASSKVHDISNLNDCFYSAAGSHHPQHR